MKKQFDIIKVDGFLYAVNKVMSLKVGESYIENGKLKVWKLQFNRPSQFHKIIATNNPDIDLPRLPEPESFTRQSAKELLDRQYAYIDPPYTAREIDCVIAGYKAAGGYTEEDLRKSIIFGFNECLRNETTNKDGSGETGIFEKDITPFIQSLKPVPKAVCLYVEDKVPLLEGGYTKVARWIYE